MRWQALCQRAERSPRILHTGESAPQGIHHHPPLCWHSRMAGYEPPTSSEAIKAVLAGIRRSIGTALTRKAPATAETVRAIMPSDLGGLRDRALLLLGFAGALRRSELAALKVDDLEKTAKGLHVRIRRSKTDQEGAGRTLVRGWKATTNKDSKVVPFFLTPHRARRGRLNSPKLHHPA